MAKIDIIAGQVLPKGFIEKARLLENPTNPDSPIEVYVLDEPGAGGACHHYAVCEKETGKVIETVDFQEGNIIDNGINGATNEAVLLMLIDRMDGFSKGPFPSRPNAVAKTHAETSLLWLDYRTAERRSRDVEGKEKA